MFQSVRIRASYPGVHSVLPQLHLWQELTSFVFSSQDDVLPQDEDAGGQSAARLLARH